LPYRLGSFWTDFLATNRERRSGCARRRRAVPAPGVKAILGRGRWDADALREIVREYALETLAEETAALVVDETGFLKQGQASCPVARQYTGLAGKITNCQIGVFASYVSHHGYAFIDRELYLPKEWTDDAGRLKAAHVPDEVGFATKPQIARQMSERSPQRCPSRSWRRIALYGAPFEQAERRPVGC
jgi:SRSO17 transposase